MTDVEFQNVLESRIEKIRCVLAVKAGEYAAGSDRLHNFKQSAALMRVTPEMACLGFLTKHLTSVIDMVHATAAGVEPTAERLDEKIGDAINYLILLEALFREPAP